MCVLPAEQAQLRHKCWLLLEIMENCRNHWWPQVQAGSQVTTHWCEVRGSFWAGKEAEHYEGRFGGIRFSCIQICLSLHCPGLPQSCPAKSLAQSWGIPLGQFSQGKVKNLLTLMKGWGLNSQDSALSQKCWFFKTHVWMYVINSSATWDVWQWLRIRVLTYFNACLCFFLLSPLHCPRRICGWSRNRLSDLRQQYTWWEDGSRRWVLSGGFMGFFFLNWFWMQVKRTKKNSTNQVVTACTMTRVMRSLTWDSTCEIWLWHIPGLRRPL